MSRGVMFDIQHYIDMQIAPVELSLLGDKSPHNILRMKAFSQVGMANTLIVDDTIVCIYGYMQLWPRVYEAIVIPSIHVPRYSIVFIKELKYWLRVIEETLIMHRLQTQSIADDMHDRFMRAMGFECEAPVLRKYGRDGTDCRMWARVY